MVTRALGRSDLGPAARICARSLFEDPYSCHFFPRESKRLAALERIERALVADAHAHGEVLGTWAAGELAGVTAWLPPGAHDPGLRRRLRQLWHVAGVARLFPRSIGATTRVAAAEASVHPDRPHWWLVVVAVDPGHRGRGIGGDFVRALVARADADGAGAYLRTTNPDNVGWYRRFGFGVYEELRPLPSAPPMWLMWRDPQA